VLKVLALVHPRKKLAAGAMFPLGEKESGLVQGGGSEVYSGPRILSALKIPLKLLRMMTFRS